MPSGDLIIAFSIASLLLIAIPGPSVLFVVGRSLALGRRGGLLTVLGNELGGVPLVVAVAFGVGVIVADSVVLFTIVKVLGAGYLVFLGIQAIRRRNHVLETPGGSSGKAGYKTVAEGFVVGVTNPKTIVFFVAVLPQFVNHAGGSVPLQMLTLGLVFTVIAFTCDATWALLAGAARSWFARSPQRLSRVRGAGGGMMIGLGGVLLLASSESG